MGRSWVQIGSGDGGSKGNSYKNSIYSFRRERRSIRIYGGIQFCFLLLKFIFGVYILIFCFECQKRNCQYLGSIFCQYIIIK